MGFVRKVMDYLLGYEVKEIVVDEHGNTTEEYPLNREKTIPKKEGSLSLNKCSQFIKSQ